MPLQPAVLDGAAAEGHPAAAAAAGRHRLLLPEDEVHHRGGLPPALCQEHRFQRKVKGCKSIRWKWRFRVWKSASCVAISLEESFALPPSLSSLPPFSPTLSGLSYGNAFFPVFFS